MIELSPEQSGVLKSQTKAVIAGPGSGKTRALVARFVESASSGPRGTALVSFTNAAVNEVRARTVLVPGLLKAPNFVGTIDSFLHRFIVTPSEAMRLGHLPSYRASWDELAPEMSTVRAGGVPGCGIRLSHFQINSDGTLKLFEGELSWESKAYLRLVESASRRDRLLNYAGALIRGYNRVGIYDAAGARVKAFTLLDGPDGSAILRRIAGRFEEVLVDEAQDCDDAEILVFRKLANSVRTLVVADPDQAIYEFRGCNPSLFLEYFEEQEASSRIVLSTNYRSSAAICSIVNELRGTELAPILPYDQARCPPVLLLSGSLREQRDKFLESLTEFGLQIKNAIVLSHRRSDAIALAGRTNVEMRSAAIGNRLILASSVLGSLNSLPSERLEAMRVIERIILSLVDWPEDLKAAGRERQLEALGLNSEWLRKSAGRTAANLLHCRTRESFGVKARSVLMEILQAVSMATHPIGSRVHKPSEEAWEACKTLHGGEEMLAFDSVHGAKGMEFPAVLLALPAILRRTNNRDVLDDWQGGQNTEARRVLYVGASRAQKLLAIGAGPHTDRLTAILASQHAVIDVR